MSKAKRIQNYLNSNIWTSKAWEIKLSASKCLMFEMGKSKGRPAWIHMMGGETMERYRKKKILD